MTDVAPETDVEALVVTVREALKDMRAWDTLTLERCIDAQAAFDRLLVEVDNAEETPKEADSTKLELIDPNWKPEKIKKAESLPDALPEDRFLSDEELENFYNPPG